MFFRITESFPYRYFIHVSKWDFFFVCLFLEKKCVNIIFQNDFFFYLKSNQDLMFGTKTQRGCFMKSQVFIPRDQNIICGF